MIELTVAGGYIDAVLDEAIGRIRIAEKSANEIPDNHLSPILSNLDQYLLDRVNNARHSTS